MHHEVKQEEQGNILITITVPPEEQEPYLKKAAAVLSSERPIKGFRNGKAPFDIVKRTYGDMAILQRALEYIVQGTYGKTIQEQKIETVGRPTIDIVKIAPDNDLVYTASVAIFPEVTLADMSTISINTTPSAITEETITETIDALRGMKAKEVVSGAAATKQDKVIIDLSMTIDNVPVDGGNAKDYQVYLSEKHYIPGFNEELIGLSKGETKTFSIPFPETHYQKQLAGKIVDCTVTIKDVFIRELPEANDEFAISLGQKSFEELRALIKENREKEEEQKTKQKQEIELLDQLIEKSTFGPIPQIIIAHEKKKMFHELTNSLEKNNVSIEQYLSDIKKKEDELFEEFTEQAVKRSKAALISRHIALTHPELQATKEAVDEEIKRIKQYYAKEEQQIDTSRPEIQETIAATIQNKNVIDWAFRQIQK